MLSNEIAVSTRLTFPSAFLLFNWQTGKQRKIGIISDAPYRHASQIQVEAIPLIKNHFKMLQMSVFLCYFYYIYPMLKFSSLWTTFCFSQLYKVVLNCQLKINLKNKTKQVVLDNSSKIPQNQESAHSSLCSSKVNDKSNSEDTNMPTAWRHISCNRLLW